MLEMVDRFRGINNVGIIDVRKEGEKGCCVGAVVR